MSSKEATKRCKRRPRSGQGCPSISWYSCPSCTIGTSCVFRVLHLWGLYRVIQMKCTEGTFRYCHDSASTSFVLSEILWDILATCHQVVPGQKMVKRGSVREMSHLHPCALLNRPRLTRKVPNDAQNSSQQTLHLNQTRWQPMVGNGMHRRLTWSPYPAVDSETRFHQG